MCFFGYLHPKYLQIFTSKIFEICECCGEREEEEADIKVFNLNANIFLWEASTNNTILSNNINNNITEMQVAPRILSIK